MSSPQTHTSSLLNIVDQLSFYRAYHFNKTNVLIHLLCIPQLLVTAYLLLIPVNFAKYLPFIDQESTLSNYCNVTMLGTIGYLTYYITLHKLGYFFVLPFLLVNYLGVLSYQLYDTNTLLKVYGSIHVVCWIAQFIGHGFFEHRAPALLDNLVQPLVLAPYFVGFEIAFHYGYFSDLQKKMNTRATQLLKEFKAKQKQRAI